MDSLEFTIQYVGGMANVRTCDEAFTIEYNPEKESKQKNLFGEQNIWSRRLNICRHIEKEEYHIASKQL